MRAGASREMLALLALLSVLCFCLFDEEPLLDFSDWSYLQVLLLAACLLIVSFELVQRARWGQFLYKDQASLLAALTFWFGLENYMRAIVIVFCLHCLTPLEIELFELVEVHHTLCVWVSHGLLPSLMLFACVLGTCRFLNLHVGGGRRGTLAWGLALASLCLLASWLVLSWDLLLAGLSGLGAGGTADVFYLQPRSGLTYDHHAGVGDQFEWHREHTQPFVMRFEDLYVFTLQLFNSLSLGLCVAVWLLLLIDFSQQRVTPTSYTLVGLGGLFLEHTFGAFLGSQLCVLGVSLRLVWRDPFATMYWA